MLTRQRSSTRESSSREAIGASFAGEPASQTLLGLIAECKDRNRRNGAPVKTRSEHVRTALKTLRGGAEPECYDPTGMPADGALTLNDLFAKGPIEITLLGGNDKRVKMGIAAPPELCILRN